MSANRFFSTLNYTSVNEDWRTEQRALQIGPRDRVLCVTGSGDRPLNLLACDPALVVAVDANPTQNRLLQLKALALRALPYERYAAFLGLTPDSGRQRTLEQLALDLPPETRAFWQANASLVKRGVLYQGRWERYFRVFSRIARALRGPTIGRLLAARTLEEQRALVAAEWDRPWWRVVFDVLCSRHVSRAFFRDPAFYAHVPRRMQIGRYLYRRMQRALTLHPIRESFMLSLVLRGCLSIDDLPPHLAPGSSATLADRVDRVVPRTADLIALLESSAPGTFTRFSLSDTPSYMDPPSFERLLRAMVRAGRPGARFCIRQFLTDHHLPAWLSSVVIREPALEAELERLDRAFAYRFIVGVVQ